MYNAEIAKRVSRLLEEYDIKKPPVPVDKLAHALNIRLISESLPEEISGILDLRNKPVMMINSGHHLNRRRFSIAHEIGHFILHKPLGIHVDKQSYFRSAKSAENLEEYEIDANKFAAALLMPEEMVSKELDQFTDWLDSDIDVLAILADTFKVSATAMGYRLQNLGYYHT
jgi:Zn-dependent peptidase ImmA (M78 family)